MPAHSLVGFLGNALNQCAYAQRFLSAGAEVCVLHPQNLVAQVVYGVVAVTARYGMRIGVDAVRAQRLAQPHIVDAAGDEHRGAHHLVNRLLFNESDAGGALEIAGVVAAIRAVPGPVGQDAGHFICHHVAQGGQILAAYAGGIIQGRQGLCVFGKDHVLDGSQPALRGS